MMEWILVPKFPIPRFQALAASSPILVGERRVSEAKQCETSAEFRNRR